MHKRHLRQRIKTLRVAKCRLTISFRKGNPPGHHARGLKRPLRRPSFFVASQHEGGCLSVGERNLSGALELQEEECLHENDEESPKDL